MNKVFKVVWNKARGCYVVASEFAKSHTKSGRGMKALAAAAAVALTLGVNGLALAANNVEGTGQGVAIGKDSNAEHDNDVAIGEEAEAEGETTGLSTAIGYHAKALKGSSTAVGAGARATDENSTAIGRQAKASGKNSTAIGVEVQATAENSTALGVGSSAKSKNSTALGNADVDEDAENGTALGNGAIVNKGATNGTALGTGAVVSADAEGGTAVGVSAHAEKSGSTALGNNANATGNSGTAIGTSAVAGAGSSTAVGNSAQATGINSVAMGSTAIASSDNSIALSNGAKAYATNSIAIGFEAITNQAAGESIAIGKSASTSGWFNTALGTKAKAQATASTALGYASEADADYSIAVGVRSGSFETYSLALGYEAKANDSNSVALGANSVTAAAVGTSKFTLKQLVNKNGKLEEADITFGTFAGNSPSGTVSIGSDSIKRTLTNLAAGRINKDSTDAINGSQLFAVADGLQTQINDLNQKITEGDHYHTVNGESSSTGTGNNAAGGGTTGSGTTSGGTGTGTGSGTASGGTGTTGTAPAGDKPILNDGYISEKGNLSIQYATDENGRKYYDISMKDNLDLSSSGSVKFGDTIINQGGLEFDANHSITKNEIKYGKTVINDNSVKVGDTINIDNSTKNISVGKDVNIDMGGNQIHNVAAGTADTDAVNYGQLKQVEQNITNNSVQINKLGDRIDKVGAGAAALAALHPLDFDPDDKFYLSAGYGNYRGENAAAIGAFYQPNDDTLFSVSSTVGNDDDMINAGVTWRFGQSSNQSRSKKAMAKEIIELRTEVAELKAMVYNLTGYGLDLEKTKVFPDTPENHWAYDYVAVAAGNGILEGYPDGQFDGSKPMTRYEMAAVVYRLLQKGAQVDNRMLLEFAPELARIKVDTVTKYKDGTPHIQRVRVINGRG